VTSELTGTPVWVDAASLVTGVCFLLGLPYLSSQRQARVVTPGEPAGVRPRGRHVGVGDRLRQDDGAGEVQLAMGPDQGRRGHRAPGQRPHRQHRGAVGEAAHGLDDDGERGPLNLAAPRPVRNAELSRALGRALKRPAILPVPALGLRVLYGEMSQVVIDGQRALPARLQALGYRFRYPEIDAALAEVLAST